jgi:ubiquinone/menaquinone biosynthesis C-methylase UbiE
MLDDSQRWDLIHQKTFNEEETHSKYAEEKEKSFPRKSIVVDFGGGMGSDAEYFLQKGHSVVILDVSQFALEKAMERAKKTNLADKLVCKQVDFGLHQLPIKENSIDIAYSRISLNYFGKNHTTKLFQDIYKMLKPGGHAYLTFKSPKDETEMKYLEDNASVYEPGVFIDNGLLKSRFTVEQLKQMLTDAGVPKFNVNPLSEDLSTHKEGHNPVLLVNEVVIEKT